MLLKSLSARLLILTIFFVMVGEVLIFVPSVARFRMTYFENRLAAGQIAILALEASPTGRFDQGLTDNLLARVGAQGVGLYRPDGTVLKLDRADSLEAWILAERHRAPLTNISAETMNRTIAIINFSHHAEALAPQ